MKTPRTDLQANTYEFETTPLVKATGFREYDARWWFGGPQYPKAPELNFLGVQALGLGLGTLIREMGVAPKIVNISVQKADGDPQPAALAAKLAAAFNGNAAVAGSEWQEF